MKPGRWAGLGGWGLTRQDGLEQGGAWQVLWVGGVTHGTSGVYGAE